MRRCATRMRNTRKKGCLLGADVAPQTSESTCASVCARAAAGPLHALFGFRVSGCTLVDVVTQVMKCNQSLFLWLLFRGAWPFCMWPFWDFSLASSPSSSDSVSSLSLRSSWTMSCQGKKKKKKGVFSGSGGAKGN